MNLSAVKQISIFLLFVFIGFGIYSNTLEAPFLLDDEPGILENPHIRIATFTEIGKVVFKSSLTRPVAFVSFAANYYFHQYNLKGYHLVNIIIHILTGIFLYLFINTTLAISKPPPDNLSTSKYFDPSIIAFAAALVWLVHPIQTQSVTYIIQRMNSMAAMFYLLSFLLYVKGRMRQRESANQIPRTETDPTLKTDASSKNRNIGSDSRLSASGLYFPGAGLAWILALGCKQTSAALPFFIFLYEWYFFQNLSKDWFKRHLKCVLGVSILFGIIALIYLGFNPLERIKSIADYAHKEFTFKERVFSQFRVVIYYLSLIFYPHPSRLNLDYDFPLSHSLIEPATTLFSLITIIGLIGLAIFIARKERLVSFCILWFFGNLVIESSVIPLAVIFEHRTYMPSMFVCLMAVTLIYRYIKPKQLAIGLLCAALIVCSVWTYKRNRIWGDAATLWKDCVDKSPNKARPHYNLGNAKLNQGKKAEAITHYAAALRLKSNHTKAHINIANALSELGKFAEAVPHYFEALLLEPDSSMVHYNLALVLASSGRTAEAIKYYSEALRLMPGHPKTHYNLGRALAKQGRLSEAISHISKAVQLDPENTNAQNDLKKLLLVREKIKATIRKTESDLDLYEDPDLYNRLGHLYKSLGELKTAIEHYKKALSIQPASLETLNNLALIYVYKSEYDQALPLFKQIIEIVPDHAGTYYNIACIYAVQNKIEDSFEWLKAAVQRGYDNWELIKTDNDLENIRKSPYYTELIEGR